MSEITEEVMQRAAAIGHAEYLRSLPFETRALLTETIAAALMAERSAPAVQEETVDLTKHASTSPGPVNCSTRLRHHKAAYPRTCVRCGLGPCPFFNNDGTAKP